MSMRGVLTPKIQEIAMHFTKSELSAEQEDFMIESGMEDMRRMEDGK